VEYRVHTWGKAGISIQGCHLKHMEIVVKCCSIF
jgi:hypothetical protein